MSTNATIRIKRKNGTETGIYCHWDGYIEGVGVTLQLAYNTADKVEKLLALGDLSSLRYYTDPKDGAEHNFDNPQSNVCVAYHRDRGEEFHQTDDPVNDFVYTFDEYEACWYVEEMTEHADTVAMQILDISYVMTRKRNLLLDRILEEPIAQDWRDDEFATADNVIKTCIEKAKEARAEIMAKQAAERQAYYNAYCN